MKPEAFAAVMATGIVSIACMPFPDPAPDAVLHFIEASRRRFFRRKQRLVNILGTEAASPSDNDPSVIFVPLQNGARADAKPPADVGRDGDLSLRGHLRLGERHDVILPR